MRFTMDDLATLIVWGFLAYLVLVSVLQGLIVLEPIWHRWQGRRQRKHLLKRLETRGR